MSAWPNLGGMKVVSTALFGGPVDGVVEFPQPSALVVGSVVAENAHVVLLHFDVPTGLEMAVSFSSRRGEAGEGQDLLVRLPHQCRPVLNRPREVANMDQIERVLLPCPFGFCIVDLELDIWGDPGGLDWAQVCSDDLGGGIVPVAANQSTAMRIRSRGGGALGLTLLRRSPKCRCRCRCRGFSAGFCRWGPGLACRRGRGRRCGGLCRGLSGLAAVSGPGAGGGCVTGFALSRGVQGYVSSDIAIVIGSYVPRRSGLGTV